MPFISAGTPVTQRIVFNSGTLDFGTNRVVEISKIDLEIKWETVTLFVLNSVKPQDLVRSKFAVALTTTVNSFSPEMEALNMGVSSAGAPNQFTSLDGQPSFANPVMTVFDRNNKQIQYQLQNAVIKSSKLSASNEAYSTWDLSIEAMDIVELYTS